MYVSLHRQDVLLAPKLTLTLYFEVSGPCIHLYSYLAVYSPCVEKPSLRITSNHPSNDEVAFDMLCPVENPVSPTLRFLCIQIHAQKKYQGGIKISYGPLYPTLNPTQNQPPVSFKEGLFLHLRLSSPFSPSVPDSDSTSPPSLSCASAVPSETACTTFLRSWTCQMA